MDHILDSLHLSWMIANGGVMHILHLSRIIAALVWSGQQLDPGLADFFRTHAPKHHPYVEPSCINPGIIHQSGMPWDP